MRLTLETAIGRENPCECGKIHRADLGDIIIGSGVISQLPALIKKYGGTKPFILDDVNTRAAAGDRVRELLGDMPFSSHTFPQSHVIPDNNAVGSAIMHFDNSCDMIIAVGSGVVGDIAKIIAATARRPMITVGTAPSMDGYASATSSMARDGLKYSVPSCCPLAVIGDTDILKNAPPRMIASGVGDMVAKYVSICEWRISNLITGEYYCESVAEALRGALRQVADNAEALTRREASAADSVMRGLLLAGVSMTWAGLSRPASGLEHSISHIWDMRAEEFGTPSDFHGIQCGVGTLMTLKIYHQLVRPNKPDRAKAMAHAANFDKEKHFAFLRDFIGSGSAPMIAAEARDGKYDPAKHAARFDRIEANWDKICAIIDEELPAYEDVERLLKTVGAPTTAAELGLSDVAAPTLHATCDIRDKYVGSRLLWDLGLIDEAAELL
ncbi:MAG: sn-glycerol-1-phosphate dehydrogenase [Clostridia bacterium]|nr:sn-glycerol-1-phosphate dehydrogenase [Clostridia bacterium]